MPCMPKPDQPSAFERQSGSRTPKGRGPRETEFVAVWEGDSEAAASIIAGGLEADGIRAVMHGSRPLPQFGMAAAGAGSWGVSVPSSKARTGAHLAARIWRRRGNRQR